MCLLVLAWQTHPQYPLIVAANRDEHHERPAAPLAVWDSAPHILAGRDLQAGGTWLGVNRQRRFGVITNFRDLQPTEPGAPSRGIFIPDYLSGAAAAGEFAASLASRATSYSGFNLLLADRDELRYASNRTQPFARALSPGVHGLSNHSLDTPWPKLLRVRERFEDWLHAADFSSPAGLFELLDDRAPIPADTSIPSGLSPELGRALSAPFVQHPVFGTRCSTVVRLDADGALWIAERRFDARGELVGETAFELSADEWN